MKNNLEQYIFSLKLYFLESVFYFKRDKNKQEKNR